mgnify:CR=1 FL=1
MKDRNLLNCKASRARKGERGLLQFKKEDITGIRKMVEEDSKFLSKLSLIDYSLLLAVECISSSDNFSPNRHTYLSSCGRYAYHIAIIDYLTEWNF